MKKYTHLSYEERVVIRVLGKIGKSSREIARELGRAPSTITRELDRNEQFKGTRKCYPHFSQMKANGRRRRAYRKPRLKSKKIQRYVISKLKIGWSPETIAGSMKKENWTERVSHEAIYQFIYRKHPELRFYLARHHCRRKKFGQSKKQKGFKIKQRTPISQRPKRIEKRKEFGHWESDLAVSKSGQTALQVSVERKSRLTKLTRIEARTGDVASKRLIQKLRCIPKGARKSITYDNGHENTKHMNVNKALGVKSFFCDPRAAWQKGTVENTIGLIRRRYPKGTNFAKVSLQELKLLERHLNHRPRKCLQFRTPVEVFNQECVALQT